MDLVRLYAPNPSIYAFHTKCETKFFQVDGIIHILTSFRKVLYRVSFTNDFDQLKAENSKVADDDNGSHQATPFRFKLMFALKEKLNPFSEDI